MKLYPLIACAPEGDPPAATPSAVQQQAPTPAPAAPPADPDAQRARDELAQLRAQQAAQKAAERQREEEAKAKAAEAQAKELDRLKAEAESLRASVREGAVRSALAEVGTIRDGFIGKFMEGLEFGDDNKPTEAALVELKKRAEGLSFLIEASAAPAPVDRTQRSTPGPLGAPVAASNWSDQDRHLFANARRGLDPLDPAKALKSPLAGQLRAAGLMGQWDQAAGGRG